MGVKMAKDSDKKGKKQIKLKRSKRNSSESKAITINCSKAFEKT